MDVLLKLNAQRSGRDKLFRTLQYSLKIVGSFQNDVGERAANIEKVIGSFRKLLRWGTCLDTLVGVKATVSHRDVTVKATTTFSRVSLALYLFYDHLIWLHKQNLIGGDVKSMERRADQWWLASILADLIRDCYEIRLQLVRQKKDLATLLKHQKPLVSNFAQNFCDMFLPLSSLQIVSMPSWFVGFMGVMSSVLGILPLVDPSFRR